MPSKEFLSRPGSIWERTDFNNGKSLPELRSEMEQAITSEVSEYDDVHWEPGTCGSISGKWVRPAYPSRSVLYYIHGGGYTLGSSGIPLPFLMELSHRLQITCFSADYRLAPEYTFPAAPQDAFAGYRSLLQLGYDPEKIIVCGESAGGTLSLDIPLMAREENLPFPRGIVAMSPVTDASSPAEGTVLKGLQETDSIMEIYAPGHDRKDPLLSPALGNLKDYPPVYLSVGGTEILLKDALTFTRKAAESGCDVRLHVGRDMIHTYPLDFQDYPEAMAAFEEIELFIRQLLS